MGNKSTQIPRRILHLINNNNSTRTCLLTLMTQACLPSLLKISVRILPIKYHLDNPKSKPKSDRESY